MSKTKALPDSILDVGFNLKAQEQFAKDKGIVLTHYAAMPSPIGLKDRGDYRRPDSLDTISENGFIYKKIGEFTGTIVSNNRTNDTQTAEAGIYDNSTARLVLPKFYNDRKPSKTKEISMLPGDRVYAKGIELKVGNYQRVEYNPKGSDILQFPACDVEFIDDSRGISYVKNFDFKISKSGNIKWIQGKNNPGIDVDTGKGRIYGIRYVYLAFWYIQSLINEIRVTNTDTAKEPSRLPYHVMIQREYIYKNRNRGDKVDTNDNTITSRTKEEPDEKLDPSNPEVKVDIRNFE